MRSRQFGESELNNKLKPLLSGIPRMVEHDHTFSTYTYCNFNQFTQRNLNDAYQNLPDVVPTPSKPFVETPVDM